MQDTRSVRDAFTDQDVFWSSPLYRRLSAAVVDDPFLIELAAHARSGQVASFAFFGAVQALLLDGAVHPLADYYPSICGARARPADEQAAGALTSFAHENAARLRDILRTRLVQTNHVQRAVGMRIALAAINDSIGGEPAHLLEIGSSAGLVLRQAAYGYQLGARRFGDPHSPLQLVTEWRSDEPVPDLDAVPVLASATGIDLNPLDPVCAADRRWLRALVWPEDVHKARLLDAALDLAAHVPVPILTGDATDLCPVWVAGVPVGAPRVVFHCATRMHVPVQDRARFDAAIDRIGDEGPLFHAAIEGDGLVVTGPGRTPVRSYDVDGHLEWASPQ